MHLYSYQLLDENVLKPLIDTESCVVVYDKKPPIHHPRIQLCDVNTFKLDTWMNKFNQEGLKTIIFQIQKFSVDCLYGFFRNIYENAIVFTDDAVFKEKIHRDITTKVNIIPSFIYKLPADLQAVETFAEVAARSVALRGLLADCEIHWLHQMCTSLYRFLKLTIYKLSVLIDMMKHPRPKHRTLVVLSNDDYVTRIYSDITSARNVLDGSTATCFVLDFDESFNYSRFAECVLFISNQCPGDMSEVADRATVKHLDAFKAFFLEAGFILDAHARLLTDIFAIHNFKAYLLGNNVVDYTKIAKSFVLDPDYHSFMKLKEVSCGNATFPFTYARSMLEHLTGIIRTSLEQYFIYLRTLHPAIHVAQGGFMNKEFCATISLPGILSFKCVGDHYVNKKDAVLDASVRFITKLIEEDILDADLNMVANNLIKLKDVQDLYMAAYGTCDLETISQMQASFISVSQLSQGDAIVEKDGKLSIVGEGKDIVKDLFKKKYMIDLEVTSERSNLALLNSNRSLSLENLLSFFYADTPKSRLERFYRKIPNCIATRPTNMSLYTFSNSKTGMLCGSSFKETCWLIDDWGKDVEISYGGTREYTDDETKMLVFYQVIFFKLHSTVYINSKQAFTLYYYVAPLNESGEIDWAYLNSIYSEFLLDYVYNKPATETMIWSPFTGEFLVYASAADMNLEDPVGNTTFLDFYERRHKVTLSIRTGKMMFKAYGARDVTSGVRKLFNTQALADPDDGTVELSPPVDAADGGSGVRYPSMESLCINVLNISSAECCFTTPVKATILAEVEIFKRNYWLIDNLHTAEEMRQIYGLDLGLRDIVTCFTQAGESESHNYEKLELIGDCVLKFITTNYLYLAGLSMDLVSDVKDYIICNQSLFRHCIDSGIYKYLKTRRFCPKMVQAPSISGADECMKYFDAIPIFNSDNYNSFIPSEDMNQDTKLYADMIEAIIGALFLAGGAKRSADFIYRLGIMKPMEFTDAKTHLAVLDDFMKATFDSLQASNDEGGISTIKERVESAGTPYYSTSALPFNRISAVTDHNSLFFRKPFTEFIYSSVLPGGEIKAVEGIIGYHYVNPGNLERALVHPSFSAQLGSMDFQYLELIGDSTLDLYITNIMAQDSTLATPLALHSHKKAFVNNSSLCRLFYTLKLDKHAKFNLPPGGRSKAYSDIAEALIGSMLVDLQWNYEKLFEVMNIKLRSALEECASEVDFN